MGSRFMFLGPLIGLCLTTACKEKTPQKTPPTSSSKTATKSSVLKSGTSGLPKIASRSKNRDAVLSHRKALKAYREKDYVEAAKWFEFAVKKDPGFILARYNLAQALTLNNEKTRSMAILLELKTNACPMCLRQVIAAPHDEAFGSIKQDKQFMKYHERRLRQNS